MFGIVKTGGKQYRVVPGNVIVVEKLIGKPGDKVTLDSVLMVSEDGKSPEIGSPLLANNAVNCLVLEQTRSNKILVFKKKRRKGYKRTKGHRQDQTVLRVLDINGKGTIKQKSSAAPQKPSASKALEKAPTSPEAKEQDKKVVTTKKKTSTKKTSTKKKTTAKKKAVVKKMTAKKKASTKKSTSKK